MIQQMFIDCRVSGSTGDAVRIIAVVDNQNDQVTIAKILPYTPSPDPYKDKTPEQIKQIKEIERNSIIVVDNGSAFKKWDICFNQVEHLDEAVKSYYALSRNKSLILGTPVQVFDPSMVIEIRKMDMRGNVYELNSDEVNNGHIAILVACWASIRMRGSVSVVEADSEPTQRDIDTFSVPFSV